MVKISTSKFQKGIFINFRDDPHQIIYYKHVNPGKGSAFIRTKLKNIVKNNVLEFTFKSGEIVEQLEVNTMDMEYLYKSTDNYVFMNPNNFEQFELSSNIIGDFNNYLKEGEKYQILILDEKAIGIKIPKKVVLKVKYSAQGSKGNTVGAAKKQVTLDTGIKVSVPLFIKEGDNIAIDPETNEYLERISD